MKHFYILVLILISHLAKAQDIALFENTWYLSNLIIDGKNNFPPINDEVSNVKLEFNQQQKTLNTNVCNECWGGNVNFSTDKNNFTVNNFSVTLIICNNETNGNFEQLYFPFFTKNTDPDIFSYTISEVDDLKTLTITSENEQAIYTNQNLKNQSFKNSFFSIYPNPAKDFINIILKDKNAISTKVNLYDSLGKLCLSQFFDAENTAINIQNFKKGFYFIKIETQDSIETQKIVVN